MKVRFNRWYNAVLTTLLSMLGYSCSLTNDEPDMYGPILMYGVVNPDATYEVKGTVTDEGGTPVEGIKTAVKFVSPVVDGADGKRYTSDINDSQSDASGHYELLYSSEVENSHIKLIVEDIDGEANGGKFQNDTIDIDYSKAVQIKKGDENSKGTFEISQDIKLKKE